MCDAIVAGNVDEAVSDFSPELRRNLGEVISLLPLPSSDGSIESVAQGGSGYVVVLRLVGESDEVEIQTRWKDRDGAPAVVEVSHLSRVERPMEAAEGSADGAEAGDEA